MCYHPFHQLIILRQHDTPSEVHLSTRHSGQRALHQASSSEKGKRDIICGKSFTNIQDYSHISVHVYKLQFLFLTYPQF